MLVVYWKHWFRQPYHCSSFWNFCFFSLLSLLPPQRLEHRQPWGLWERTKGLGIRLLAPCQVRMGTNSSRWEVERTSRHVRMVLHLRHCLLQGTRIDPRRWCHVGLEQVGNPCHHLWKQHHLQRTCHHLDRQRPRLWCLPHGHHLPSSIRRHPPFGPQPPWIRPHGCPWRCRILASIEVRNDRRSRNHQRTFGHGWSYRPCYGQCHLWQVHVGHCQRLGWRSLLLSCLFIIYNKLVNWWTPTFRKLPLPASHDYVLYAYQSCNIIGWVQLSSQLWLCNYLEYLMLLHQFHTTVQ